MNQILFRFLALATLFCCAMASAQVSQLATIDDLRQVYLQMSQLTLNYLDLQGQPSSKERAQTELDLTNQMTSLSLEQIAIKMDILTRRWNTLTVQIEQDPRGKSPLTRQAEIDRESVGRKIERYTLEFRTLSESGRDRPSVGEPFQRFLSEIDMTIDQFRKKALRLLGNQCHGTLTGSSDEMRVGGV